jgi:hypothetical protein
VHNGRAARHQRDSLCCRIRRIAFPSEEIFHWCDQEGVNSDLALERIGDISLRISIAVPDNEALLLAKTHHRYLPPRRPKPAWPNRLSSGEIRCGLNGRTFARGRASESEKRSSRGYRTIHASSRSTWLPEVFDVEIPSTGERAQGLDLQYVDKWSAGLDARIILMTILQVLSGRPG